MGSFELRKAAFTALVDYRRAHTDKVSDFIDVTLALLKNTGMTHFVLIDKYLVTLNHPTLMSEKAKPDIDNLIQAYTYLKGVADDQKNYLKFLKSDDELGVLNRQKFKNVTAIAYHLAIRKEPSLSNYNPALTEMLTRAEKTLMDDLDNAFGKSVDLKQVSTYVARYGQTAYAAVQKMLDK
uniref:Uncharacterized protein n=1 Tax=Romanomermis culicivorax TaxID=13658 RepID=A0A915IZA8_ROMCU